MRVEGLKNELRLTHFQGSTISSVLLKSSGWVHEPLLLLEAQTATQT